MSARTFAVLFLLALVAAPRVAGATEPTAPGPAASGDDARTRARAIFEVGSRHHKVGEYEEAIARYKEAYKIAGESVYLYDIALAYRDMGAYPEAARYFELYLADDPDTPLRKDVEATILDLRAHPSPPLKPGKAKPAALDAGAGSPASAPAAGAPPAGKPGGRLVLPLAIGGGALAIVTGVVIGVLVAVTRSLKWRESHHEGPVFDFRSGP